MRRGRPEGPTFILSRGGQRRRRSRSLARTQKRGKETRRIQHVPNKTQLWALSICWGVCLGSVCVALCVRLRESLRPTGGGSREPCLSYEKKRERWGRGEAASLSLSVSVCLCTLSSLSLALRQRGGCVRRVLVFFGACALGCGGGGKGGRRARRAPRKKRKKSRHRAALSVLFLAVLRRRARPLSRRPKARGGGGRGLLSGKK